MPKEPIKPIDLTALMAATPSEESTQETPAATKGPEPEAKVEATVKGGSTYFYSERGNFAFFVRTGKRIQFKGNFLITEDKEVIDFINAHFLSKGVSEITEEMMRH